MQNNSDSYILNELSDGDQKEKNDFNESTRDEKNRNYNKYNNDNNEYNDSNYFSYHAEKGENNNDNEISKYGQNQTDLSSMNISERKKGSRNFDADQDKKAENSLVDLLSSKEITYVLTCTYISN